MRVKILEFLILFLYTRIIEAYENESVKPTFHSDELYFRVTLPNTSYHKDDSEQKEPVSSAEHHKLSEREIAVRGSNKTGRWEIL